MRKERKTKKIVRRFLWIIIAVVLWVSLMIGICVAFYLTLTFSVSADELLPTLGAQPRTPQFYIYSFEDRTNRIGVREVVSDEVWSGKQTLYVPYKEIPQAMIDAVVAIEDKRFFEHRGVDWYRTVAATGNFLLRGDGHFGGARNTFPVRRSKA